jgi:hypothetical protein
MSINKDLKKQKILIGLFIAMVAVPEILWSPVIKSRVAIVGQTVNGHYKFFRKNFLDNYGNVDLWNNLILFQLVGNICLFVYLIFLKNYFKNKAIFLVNRNILIFIGIIRIYVL